ncbi:transmembrane protein 225B isoform X8 [Vulpes lagopus]|uniref:transmembrane protein 225B isoform X8 n=1 Tax=Vulpes lagopus TaxID=494514 RepID=UPI001BC8CFE8|nr:transmembrane protein 225B isoform X8 [Vulpes lagopus]
MEKLPEQMSSESLCPSSVQEPRRSKDSKSLQVPVFFSSLNCSHRPKLSMGRPVVLTLDDKDMKGFTWAIAPALTSLGYLLILLVSIFPFWVRLVNEESHEVFFSGLFENCFHIKCWKPRPLSGNAQKCELHGRWLHSRSCFTSTLGRSGGCLSWKRAVSKDPEAQFGVGLHQLPHRGLCLPGLVAACPGDPESEDEAQPPPVLRTVALLRPWLCHSSVYSGWCHLPLSRNSLPWLPFVAQLPEYGGDPRGPTPGESGEFGRRTELNTKGDTAEGRNNYLVQESILHLSSAV